MADENAGESVAVLRHDAPSVAMHWLPCAIDQTGEAPVAAYFMPRDSDTGELERRAGLHCLRRFLSVHVEAVVVGAASRHLRCRRSRAGGGVQGPQAER